MIAGPANPEIFDHMTALADPVRCRALILLENNELTVSDLCTVLQLPQSSASRQLKALSDRGWVQSRPDGTRRLYRATVEGQSDASRQLWDLARQEVAATSASRLDQERLQSVLARQRSRTQEFFDDSSSEWDRLRDELFGSTFHLAGLMGLVEGDWTVAELGCGSGPVAEALAPFVRKVVAIDASRSMLELAQRRLQRFDNVELRCSAIESLPLKKNEVNAATMMLVLHHLEDPGAVIAEAARCLRPGGKLLIVDMLPHDRAHYQQEMGHRWLGFSEEDVVNLLSDARLEEARVQALPPATEAKGPRLFAASARKPAR